jgi:hypothetical protein
MVHSRIVLLLYAYILDFTGAVKHYNRQLAAHRAPGRTRFRDSFLASLMTARSAMFPSPGTRLLFNFIVLKYA